MVFQFFLPFFHAEDVSCYFLLFPLSCFFLPLCCYLWFFSVFLPFFLPFLNLRLFCREPDPPAPTSRPWLRSQRKLTPFLEDRAPGAAKREPASGRLRNQQLRFPESIPHHTEKFGSLPLFLRKNGAPKYSTSSYRKNGSEWVDRPSISLRSVFGLKFRTGLTPNTVWQGVVGPATAISGRVWRKNPR